MNIFKKYFIFYVQVYIIKIKSLKNIHFLKNIISFNVEKSNIIKRIQSRD